MAGGTLLARAEEEWGDDLLVRSLFSTSRHEQNAETSLQRTDRAKKSSPPPVNNSGEKPNSLLPTPTRAQGKT